MCNYSIYIGITPEIRDRGARWVLIVVNPNGQSCTYYLATGGPESATVTPYKRDKVGRKDFLQPYFAERIAVGSIREENLNTFESVFRKTVPGPNQFFVVRLLYRCVKENLIEKPGLVGLLSRADYTKREWEYFGNRYSVVDAEFLNGGTLAAKVTSWIRGRLAFL
ncbi:hypothetical protein BJX99DRAFT_263639 [Aspergillus californicus]